MSLAKRSISSAGWNISVSLINVVVGVVRSVLLARLLPVEVFGPYALAMSVMAISVQFLNFGMSGAFLHRAPESQDEGQTAAVHFTLKSMFTVVWTALLVLGTILLTSGPDRTALLLVTFTSAGMNLAQTARLILIRRVVHRRLAVLHLVDITLSALVAVWLAWQGAGLWALLSTDIISLLLTIIFLYVWRPVWRPRLTWSPQVMRYFLHFGSRTFLADVLQQALNEVDDLWTRIFLGTIPLSFYSKSYQFATYPRRILAMPLNAVAGGTYAELKENRLRLSQAFFRTNAFLVRSGFFLAGLLALVAPEFIRIVLTDKWLPMLEAFRLMLVFTLLDPIRVTVNNLFVAVGRPEQVAKANLVQLFVLVVGLVGLGTRWGIAGVALAVDVMLVVGITILLWQARAYVRFSPLRMFGIPSLALGTGIVVALVGVSLPQVPGSDWYTGMVKTVLFMGVYWLILLIAERQQFFEVFSFLTHRVRV
jgi:O-antigen/teichoic acid export membrane protein